MIQILMTFLSLIIYLFIFLTLMELKTLLNNLFIYLTKFISSMKEHQLKEHV